MNPQTSALHLAGELGHAELTVVQDRTSGLRAVIALDAAALGTAVGGTRMRPYASLDAAGLDALRLSRRATYGAALAGLDCGGGSGVILGDPRTDKTRGLLSAYAKVLDRLGGRFHTGQDVGVDRRDVAVMGRTTRHVSHARAGSGQDTTELTARGVLASIRAAARELGLELDGLRVAVQGLGQVGYSLAKMLGAAGARVTVADIVPARTERAVAELGVEAVEPDAIFEVEADVFSPNAVGGVLDDETIPRLRARAIVGAAETPLADERSGDLLHEKDVLYAPDVLAGTGGLLALAGEIGDEGPEETVRRVGEIGDRLAALWRQSREEGVPVHRLASKLAEEKLAPAHERRRG